MKKIGFFLFAVLACCGCLQNDQAVDPVPVELRAYLDLPAVILKSNIPLDSAAIQGFLSLEPKLSLLLEEDGHNIRITPRGGWPDDTECTLTVLPFTVEHAALAEPFQFTFRTPPAPAFELVAVGDVMLDYLTGARLRHYDPQYPFSRIAPHLRRGDLVFANLECPISDRGAPAAKTYAFRAAPFAFQVLTGAGINLVSVANNHALDYGADAFLDTLAGLGEHGIAYAGGGANGGAARRGARLDIEGVAVAVLAYSGVICPECLGWQAGAGKPGILYFLDRDAFAGDIQKAREEADVVIVSMHWGNEYTYRVNLEQREMGRLAVESGADLVLGHHSHTPQGIEIYRGKPIVYSMGNFLFYPFTTYPFCNESFILKARVGSGGVENLRLLPVVLGDSRPEVPSGDALLRLQVLLCSLLDEFATPWEIDGAEIVIPVHGNPR